jgi:hypothetical protein
MKLRSTPGGITTLGDQAPVSLNATIDVAKFIKDVSEVPPVPFLKGSFGTVVAILEIIKVVS